MFNIEKMIVNTDNIFDIPSVPRPASFDFPDYWISFADLSQFHGVYCDTGLHFFTSDRDFECVWKNPDRYIPIFKRFACIVMPDFSIYYDLPFALQIYNKYRSHWLACYFALHGVVVLPNVSFTLPKYDYIMKCGFPLHSVLVVSSVGSVRSPEERDIFLSSVDRVFTELAPVELLHFTSSKLRLDNATNIYIKGGKIG